MTNKVSAFGEPLSEFQNKRLVQILHEVGPPPWDDDVWSELIICIGTLICAKKPEHVEAFMIEFLGLDNLM